MIDTFAMYLGYTVIVTGAVYLTGFGIYTTVNYLYRRFVDIHMFAKVIQEAKKQGRPLVRSK